MTCNSNPVWLRLLAITGLLIGLSLSSPAVQAQPESPTDGAAEVEPDAASAADTTLNLGSMIEKHPKIKEILETLKEGDREQTMAELNAYADSHDELPPGGVILAVAFNQPNQAAAQQAALDSAVQSNPNDPDAYLLLGQKAVSQRRMTEAGLLLAKAEGLVEKYQASADRKRSMLLRFHRDSALLDEQNKAWTEAATHWKTLLDVEDSAGARYRYARALFYMGSKEDRKKALEEVTAANKMDGKVVPLPYVAIATLYDEIDKPEQTKKWFDAAEKAHPDDANTHLRFAYWQWKQGDAAEALRHAEAALKSDEENIDALFLKGMVLRYNNETEKAQEVFVKCQMMRPAVSLIRNHLSLVRLDLGDATSTTMARNMAVETFQKNQRDPFTLATLGYILFKSGDQKRGLQYLQAITRTPNLNPDARFFLASALVDLGKSGDAKKQLEQLLSEKRLFAYRGQAERLLAGIE